MKNPEKKVRPEKVLFLVPESYFDAPGGWETQIRRIAEKLQTSGIQVEVSSQEKPNAANFDLVHLFGVSHQPLCLRQVWHIREKFHKPLVITPAWWDTSQAIWAAQAIKKLKYFKKFTSPEKGLYLSGNWILGSKTAHTFNLPPRLQLAEKTVALLGDFFLPNSQAEMENFTSRFGLVKNFRVVYQPMEANVWSRTDPDWFVKKYALKNFVLSAGEISPAKNQLSLLFALKGTGIPVVLIGKAANEEYLKACREIRPQEPLLLLSGLSDTQLASAYAAAKVLVLPSFAEIVGRVCLEGALSGCSVVTTGKSPYGEYFGGLARVVNPGNPTDIREKVLEAWENYPREAERRELLKQKIGREFTWENALDKTLEGYRKALESYRENRLWEKVQGLKLKDLELENRRLYRFINSLLQYLHPVIDRDKVLERMEKSWLKKENRKLKSRW